MSLNRCYVFVFGWLVSTTCPTVLAAQADPAPSLDSLQRTIANAPTDSAAGVALDRALFALQASNRFADTLLALAVTGRGYRTVVFASLGLIPYHNPRTVAPLIRRALLPQTTPVERYYLLNASAYTLGIGDVLLLGRGGDLDSETVQTARGLLDLADSAVRHGLGMEHARRLQPGTIHSFALRLLVQHPGTVAVPHPIRIPDTWETKQIIRPYLAAKLRRVGHVGVTTNTVKLLEREMSARWESLDPDLITLATIDPQLRNAYICGWNEHRWRYGYVLLAELPSRAGDLITDFDVDLANLRFLVVDEFQDLNKADIRLLARLADANVKILAIGDDDQSIYRFRMAAPEGLRLFHETFDNAADYPLSVGLRCGRLIIEAATTIIETMPNRPPRARLMPKAGAVNGEFVYLHFQSQTAEARGVAQIVSDRMAKGVEPRNIAILVRSRVETWADLVGPELADLNIPFMDADWVERTLAEPPLRFALAVARLTQDRTDSLAWWTLLQLTPGISSAFRAYVDQACQDREHAGQALLRLYPAFENAPTATSRDRARQLITEQLAVVDAVNLEGVQLDEEGWGGWLRRRVPAGTLSANAEKLLATVGRTVPPDDGLGYFLGQLEPVGKDLAAKEDVVRIMSITTSKGLTVDSAILMGCEAGIMPHPKGTPDEELRLLYVATTRAVNFMALTAARRRTGATARHGNPNVNRPRGRCPMLDTLPIGDWQDGRTYVQNLAGEPDRANR